MKLVLLFIATIFSTQAFATTAVFCGEESDSYPNAIRSLNEKLLNGTVTVESSYGPKTIAIETASAPVYTPGQYIACVTITGQIW